MTSLVMKLYSDAMCSQVPVCVVSPIFKVAENGHRYVEAGKLFPADWAEPKIENIQISHLVLDTTSTNNY